jgi:uncharacterized protein (TIGR02246 family)
LKLKERDRADSPNALRDSAVHDCFPAARLKGEIKMMRIHRTLLLFGVATTALTLSGCSKNGAGSTDAGAVQAALKADEAKWNDQFKSKDMEGLLSHYADEAFFVAPGVPGAKGSTEIRKAYSEALSDNYFNISFASDTIDTSGDLAYARGHFSEKYQDRKSGKIISDSGTYLTIYKKQEDGSWKAIEDFAAADPATQKSEAPTAVMPAKKISM